MAHSVKSSETPRGVTSATEELTRENTLDSPVVQALQRQTANAFVLYANYKHYHWQTYGPHFWLWLVRSRPPPKIHAPPAADYAMNDVSQLPINGDHLYRDREYSWDDYIQNYRIISPIELSLFGQDMIRETVF